IATQPTAIATPIRSVFQLFLHYNYTKKFGIGLKKMGKFIKKERISEIIDRHLLVSYTDNCS
ncbi:MAG: hypothetical protein IJS68_03925, partial [Clostridia bacterium]|nr:hypothetical protein [Clostridia bacterium]